MLNLYSSWVTAYIDISDRGMSSTFNGHSAVANGKNASVNLLLISNWSRMDFVGYKSEGLTSGERVVAVPRKLFTDMY